MVKGVCGFIPCLECSKPKESTLSLAKMHLESFNEIPEQFNLLNKCLMSARRSSNVLLKITILSI